MSVLAALRVVLGLETGPFQKGATKAQMEAQKLVKSVERTGRQIATVGAGISAGLTLPFAALMNEAIPAAVGAQQAMAQVTAALSSMGPVAGRTAEQLAAFADRLEDTTNFDGDEILTKVTANLLTFGNIQGDVFDRAQVAATNLSARLGQDLQSSAIQLGKALNDPIKGLTALSKVGVTFTAEQRALIEGFVAAGDTAKAQGIILSELERQFDDAAEAQRRATPQQDVIVAWGRMQEAIGKVALEVLPKLIPPVERLINAFVNLSPEVQTMIVGAVAIGAALGPFMMLVGGLVTALAGLAPVIAPVLVAFKTLAVILATGAIPALGGLLAVLSPVLVPLAAVAAAVGAVWLAWKNWDSIKPILDRVWAVVKAVIVDGIGKVLSAGRDAVMLWYEVHKTAFEFMIMLAPRLYRAVKEWLQDKLNAVWDWLGKKIAAVKGFFFDLYDAVVGNSYIPDMVDGIALQMARLDKVMVDPAKTAAENAKAAFEQLEQDVDQIMRRVFPEDARYARFLGDKAALEDAIASGGAGGYTPDQLKAARTKLINDEFSTAFDHLKTASTETAAVVETANVRIVKSFQDTATDTMNALKGMADSIKSGGFLDILRSVLNLGMQLGSIGMFGKSVANNINSQRIPKYAKGTGYHQGGLAIVGEDGPELVNMPRGSSVTPNGRWGGGGIAQIIPSPYFDIIVDGRVQRAAPGIAAVGADAGSRMALGRSAWQNQWTLR